MGREGGRQDIEQAESTLRRVGVDAGDLSAFSTSKDFQQASIYPAQSRVRADDGCVGAVVKADARAVEAGFPRGLVLACLEILHGFMDASSRR